MLNKFSVRRRLLLLIIITTSAILGLGLLGYTSLKFMNEEIDQVFLGGIDEVENVINIRDNLTWAISSNLNKVNDGLIKPEEALERIQQAKAKAFEDWNAYTHRDLYLGDEIKQLWDQKAEQITSSLKNIDNLYSKIRDALQQNKSEELNSLIKNNLYTTIDPFYDNFNQIIKLHVKDVNNDYIEAKQRSSQIISIMFIALGLSLALSFIVAYAIMTSIVKPLNNVVENVDRLSEGDISMNIQSEEGGELGKLLNAVINMIASTKKISTVLVEYASGNLTDILTPRSNRDTLGIALNKMSAQMRAIIGDIKSEVNVMTSSSHEILASLSQLASGSSESAAAVTETTTTLEELKQTARVSSDKANDVLASAEKTLSTVQGCEKSVQSVIEDMNQIKDRMQIISESILKLSEKGLAISEIMDSVNDIAEQSNLLAVNAAIEAAKAGEQGKSFSVVAQEIRTLAEQSKNATIQVRSLLNEIQGATNSAVLATEQGSKAVAKGVEQSKKTTDSIKELSGNMIRVTQAANQIVLSNQQQSVGTEQISLAMSNINEATHQHVDRLKEIETAVATLNQVSTSLKELTDQYKINEVESRERVTGERLSHLLEKKQKPIDLIVR